MKKRKLFCQYGKIPYQISLCKECLRRDFKDFLDKNKIAKSRTKQDLEYIWKSDAKLILRKLHGVDMELQVNKIKNLEIAGNRINNLIIKPGETFSFWNIIGNPTRKKGYLKGLVIRNGEFGSYYGGGLCQLANLIHYLVLHTPLEVVELHHHTDALFPDYKRKVPFGIGTSVSFKNVDYRFKNNLDVPIQLKVWQDDTMLYGEIRSVKPLEYKYKLEEEDNHYKMEDGIYYRNSKVYRIKQDRETKEIIDRELILKNHSKVMYDYNLIPKEEIRGE
ncbi:MAG: VanW family protein [Clostridia bacterium]|nr:VanW family protein [Clostridia bacterium]